MVDRPSDKSHPAEQLLALANRTLWALYIAFWIAVVLYGAILIAMALMGSEAARGVNIGATRSWGPLQLALLAAGLLSAFVAQRLRGTLQAPERIWEGATDLDSLARQLEQRRGRQAEMPAENPHENPHGHRLSQAVQHLLGRLIVAHLVPWALAELPAILGLIERFVTGGRWLAPLLVLVSAAGLLATRPDRARLRRILDPIFQTPVRT